MADIFFKYLVRSKNEHSKMIFELMIRWIEYNKLLFAVSVVEVLVYVLKGS